MTRIAVITGAASGLGLSLAERFLKAGDRVFGITRSKRHWNSVRKNLASHLGRFHLMQGDVSREGAARNLCTRIKKEAGRIDLLINNAGYANKPTPLEKESLHELEKNLAGNLISVFLMCKYTLPIFKKQKSGWVINVSSMAGKRAVPFLAAYSAAKSGVLALSQSIAKENPKSGFKCITVCPGGMNTDMRAKLFGKEDADRQQSTDFVADKIMEVIAGTLPVPSGGDIVIRHGRVAAINPPPEA